MWWHRPGRPDPDAARADTDAGAGLQERDRRLAARMIGGDESAFTEFFDRHFSRLYRFALARLGYDESAAEDVVQATLSRAVLKLSSYRGEATLFTWLCAICRHEISDHRRRCGRYVSMDLVEDSPEVRGILESLAAADPDHPETAARRAEVSRLVQAVLDVLPEHYADALEWKYLLGLSVREIADRLGVGPKAAESVLSRARRAFRDGFSAVSGRTAGRTSGWSWE